MVVRTAYAVLIGELKLINAGFIVRADTYRGTVQSIVIDVCNGGIDIDADRTLLSDINVGTCDRYDGRIVHRDNL